jgi:hypothetical protein
MPFPPEAEARIFVMQISISDDIGATPVEAS